MQHIASQCHNCGAFTIRSLCHEADYKNSAFLQRLRTSNVPATDQPLYTLSSPADFNAFDASGSIWQLSHVCQRWRNVALSLQSFWSTMDVYFPEAAQSKADVERLKAGIQRSRQGLLSVALNDDDKPQGPAAQARHCPVRVAPVAGISTVGLARGLGYSLRFTSQPTSSP